MAKQRAISVRRARHRITGCLYSYGPFADGTLQSDFPTYLSDSPKACLSFPTQPQYYLPHSSGETPMLPAPNNRYQSAPVCIQGILLYPNHPKDASFIGSYQSYGHIERSSLTGAVRPQQSHNFSLLYVDRDMADYCTLSVLLHQILCPEYHFAFFFHNAISPQLYIQITISPQYCRFSSRLQSSSSWFQQKYCAIRRNLW